MSMDMDGQNFNMLDRVASTAWPVTDIDWNAIAPTSTVNFVSVCSEGLGASKESFFFPLLSAAAAVLGRNATINLNDFWPEPPIVWTAVLADEKCRKKSAVQRFIVTSMKEAMDNLISEHAQQLFLTSPQESVITSFPTVNQMSDTEFDVEKLATCYREGTRECFLFSKDLCRVYRALQSETGTNDIDTPTQRSERYRECFFDLPTSGHSPWPDEAGVVFSDVRFNLTGFIHPDEAIRLINSSPASRGFLDSTVAIVASKSGKVYHGKPVGTTAPLLAPILLKLRQEHKLMRVYSLDDEAHAAFASYYNDVEERLDRMSAGDSCVWRMLSKSQGHVARLALVLHCLDHVTQTVCEQGQIIQKFETSDLIPEMISGGTMYNAINLMRMCIRQKTELINAAALARDQSSVPRGVSEHTQTTPARELKDRRNSSPRPGSEVVVLDSPDAMNVKVQATSDIRPTTSPVLAQRRVSETLHTTSPLPRASHQPMQLPILPQNTVNIAQTSVPIVPLLPKAPMAPQSQRHPMAVSIDSGGPHIVQVSYTPQGSHIPVNTQPQTSKYNNLVPLNRIASAQSTNIAPARPVSFAVSRPRSSLSIPPRTPSRMSPAVAKALGRKVVKKTSVQSSISSLPTSHDYRNFLEICPGKARRLLIQGMNSLEAVWVAQRKLIPPIIDTSGGVTGRRSYKYPTNAARAFLTALADAGLGEMVSRTGGRSGKSTFRKRKYQDLSPGALEILRKLNISKSQYTYVKNMMYAS